MLASLILALSVAGNVGTNRRQLLFASSAGEFCLQDFCGCTCTSELEYGFACYDQETIDEIVVDNIANSVPAVDTIEKACPYLLRLLQKDCSNLESFVLSDEYHAKTVKCIGEPFGEDGSGEPSSRETHFMVGGALMGAVGGAA
eukprot:CAMPEP_0183336346 /NCGR_PEP_ID=MMETSP0164_2-20130417/4348_1 /TAXON_ID=221442 /ORGANISM="Coccolithus pelagicus ssp braarudi, Strain PLY182g" /LENGTH=143 /DNA_ID=CAMNT_0025505847 /DNA_START=65 /DNA_END=496 /DNA_ORIENTATION=+